MARVIDLNPVTRITAGAMGKPGQRVFYIQAETATQRIAVLCEKQQVQALGLGVQEYLQEVQRDHPSLLTPTGSFLAADMELQEPLEPLFRVGQFGLGYDDETDRVILVAQEEQGEDANPDDATTVRFWATRSQLLAMAQHGMEVAARGRPICGNCLQPIDPEGHFCPKRNGHRY
ncbi:MAG TPA: DUF3090 domain-containing protein [Anaerolineales bacterium]|nr:DUF3090 domain-containing protein [Anaerolineales bacterium]